MPTTQQNGRDGSTSGMFGVQENTYAGPKTSLPRLATQQQQQLQQQQIYNPAMMGMGQQYTADQILAPPQLHIDEDVQEQMDPSFYAQLVAANMHLAQQQQRLQQQLLSIQAAAQQFSALNMNGQVSYQQQIALQSLYQQQQQLQTLQQSLASMQQPQQNVYAYYDPNTGKQAYYVDQNQGQYNNAYLDQPATPQNMTFQQATSNTPRVEVSPPPMEPNEKPFFRSTSPPKRTEVFPEPTPLPPPSANAFRRGHKKVGSVANQKGLSLSTEDANKAAGPKSGVFPLSPLASGYGPGQARAGEHPVRQPRGPPSIDELRAKPTAKVDGSKNFAARTRRSAVHNLVRAGLERRKGTSSSSGSMSPVSETAEEAGSPLTDNESDSGRSGSGSLSGDAEPSLASSRTSIHGGSWGAIGSDRPSSRSKSRKSVESLSSACDSEPGSFANVFKHGAQYKSESTDGQRKAPMLVLTSVERRKGGVAA